MRNPLLWITVANVLYLASYSVRDILWLRILTVVGALLLIPYYALQPLPLAAAIAWNGVFIAINVYWVARLVAERQPVKFSPDEERLRELSFPSLTPREAKGLFAMGVWDDITVGASIVQHDNETDRFSVILSGLADVIHGETKIAEFGEGQFVGVIDRHAARLNIDVLVREAVRVMCWSRSKLQEFLRARPDVALALERSVGLEVRHLLDTALAKLNA